MVITLSVEAVSKVSSFLEVFWKCRSADAQLKGTVKIFDLVHGNGGLYNLRVRFFDAQFSHYVWRSLFVKGEQTEMKYKQAEYLFNIDRNKLTVHGKNLAAIKGAGATFDLEKYLQACKN